MQTEYKAKLNEGKVEWSAAPPPFYLNGAEVLVTVLPSPRIQETTKAERGRAMRAALEKLAASGAFADIKDPVAWQREIRKDGILPGREA